MTILAQFIRNTLSMDHNGVFIRARAQMPGSGFPLQCRPPQSRPVQAPVRAPPTQRRPAAPRPRPAGPGRTPTRMSPRPEQVADGGKGSLVVGGGVEMIALTQRAQGRAARYRSVRSSGARGPKIALTLQANPGSTSRPSSELSSASVVASPSAWYMSTVRVSGRTTHTSRTP